MKREKGDHRKVCARVTGCKLQLAVWLPVQISNDSHSAGFTHRGTSCESTRASLSKFCVACSRESLNEYFEARAAPIRDHRKASLRKKMANEPPLITVVLKAFLLMAIGIDFFL